MNERKILEIMKALREAKYFEDAAQIVLEEMLEHAKTALEKSAQGRRGRILRGMVHLRPGDCYRRLFVREDAKTPNGPTMTHVPSASAWRWIAQYDNPVSIDVGIGRVAIAEGQSSRVVSEAGFSGKESMQRLTSRDVSHLYAVPLRALRGNVEGMATVETDCPGAIGSDGLLLDIAEPFQMLADMASPHLVSLPMGNTTTLATDELLPIIGPTMAPLIEMLRVFARQEETLLIGGPTGAGKSRIARWCHSQSPRRRGPFEVLDLLTIPEELQMAELFGWRKGAFTGATRDTNGCVSRAMRGTLFIDEIDKLSLKAQAGLLHLLEARTYRPLGDSGAEKVADVRFMAGSNADLHALVKQGKFREDLYYRINVLPVKIPPLDERRDEIAQWAHFMALRRHRESIPSGEVTIAPASEKLLLERPWPGNLRQLDNVVRRAYVLALVSQGDAATNVTLTEAHFSRALGYEQGAARRSVIDSLRQAAISYIEEAERLYERGQGLDLDHCDAFRGVVLGTAIERHGDRASALRLLGRAQYVQNRNHSKLLKRELERVDLLCKAVGDEKGSPFEALLEADRESTEG
jgi:transcriptional regulator with AAA-type ATPase domain